MWWCVLNRTLRALQFTRAGVRSTEQILNISLGLLEFRRHAANHHFFNSIV